VSKAILAAVLFAVAVVGAVAAPLLQPPPPVPPPFKMPPQAAQPFVKSPVTGEPLPWADADTFWTMTPTGWQQSAGPATDRGIFAGMAGPGYLPSYNIGYYPGRTLYVCKLIDAQRGFPCCQNLFSPTTINPRTGRPSSEN
jgi:hypothetical protein